jgi:AcrR family transcriptional regulator
METALERALAAQGGGAAATPLDALRVAREVFLRGERIDMGALAAALGISRATLYRWVGTKERLLGEVAWSFAEPALRAARELPGHGPDRIADVVAHYLRASLEFEPMRRFLLQEPEYALKVIASKASPLQRRSIAATRELLQEEVDKGTFVAPLALDTLAYAIVRISESFLYNDVITGDAPDVEQAVETIRALLHAPPMLHT